MSLALFNPKPEVNNAMADYGEPIFQSTLHIQKIAHQVALTSSHLVWEQASKGGPLDSPSVEPLFCT